MMQMSAKWEYKSINTLGMSCVIMDDVLYFQEGVMLRTTHFESNICQAANCSCVQIVLNKLVVYLYSVLNQIDLLTCGRMIKPTVI